MCLRTHTTGQPISGALTIMSHRFYRMERRVTRLALSASCYFTTRRRRGIVYLFSLSRDARDGRPGNILTTDIEYAGTYLSLRLTGASEFI
jgi:hypothetical protein